MGWSVGLGPVSVPGAFDVPAGVLALDDAGVGARASPGQEPADKFADGVGPEPDDSVFGVRGEAPCWAMERRLIRSAVTKEILWGSWPA